VIKRLLAPGTRLTSADLVVPRHVALRFAGGGAPGRNRWKSQFVAAVAGELPRSAFRPPPTVRTAVLRLEWRCRPAPGDFGSAPA
jgi:23S rRNA (adenine-N6)-dimethyltransferase